MTNIPSYGGEGELPSSGATGPEAPSPKATRTSAAWVGIIVAVVALVLLLVFILQNTKSVKISFLTFNGTMPLGVSLLFAALGGVLIAGAVVSLRSWRLRRRANKSRTPGTPS
jgi:lipopolysaccharide assembly protein A